MRKKRELDDVLTRMRAVVWRALRQEYTSDCCIAATAIVIRVLKHYGHAARAVPVTFSVANDKWLRFWATATNLDGLTIAESEQLFKLTGAWAVAIKAESARLTPVHGGRYGGHLVVHVGNYLVDASLAQADRPERNLRVPDFLVSRVDERFFRGEMLVVPLDAGTLLRYRLHDDYSFRSAPDWKRRTSPVPETVSRIIAGIEGNTTCQ